MAHGHGQRTEKATSGPVDNRENHASIMASRRRTRGAFGPTDADPVNEPHTRGRPSSSATTSGRSSQATQSYDQCPPPSSARHDRHVLIPASLAARSRKTPGASAETVCDNSPGLGQSAVRGQGRRRVGPGVRAQGEGGRLPAQAAARESAARAFGQRSGPAGGLGPLAEHVDHDAPAPRRPHRSPDPGHPRTARVARARLPEHSRCRHRHRRVCAAPSASP